MLQDCVFYWHIRFVIPQKVWIVFCDWTHLIFASCGVLSTFGEQKVIELKSVSHTSTRQAHLLS